MRLINDLEVVSDSSEISELMNRLDQREDDRWRREREPVERLQKILSAPVAAFCFSIGGKPSRPAATVWLERKGPDKLVVSHIVPAERRALTDEEYNTIVEDFGTSVLRPLIDGVDVDLRIIPPLVKLEESIPPDAMESLRSFTKNALPSDLSDLDWQAWGRFLIQMHLDGWALDGADLDWWLEEKGWPKAQRRRLVDSYRAGLALLAEYDEERVPT